MTLLLEQAIDKLSHIPPDKQDTIASLIFDALADEDRWDSAFAKSQDKLTKLTVKVRQDIAAGQIKQVETANPFPLKNTVLKYEDPTEPVAEEDWDVLQ